MRIKRLEARGVKGQDFEVALGAVTVIGGPNASGKTATTDAITLALTGAVPSIGKSTTAIYHALAGNGSAKDGSVAVRAEFDDGAVASVSLVKTGGKVSCDARIPFNVSLHPALADPEAFFRLTGQERARAIFEASGSDAVDVNAVLGIIRAVDGDPVARRAVRDGVVNGLIDEVDKLMAETEPAARVKALSSRMSEWKTRATEARGVVKQLASVINGVRLDHDAKPVPPDVLVALEAEQDALKRKLWESDLRNKHRQEGEAAITARRAELEKAEKAEASKRAEIIDLPDVDAEAEARAKADGERLDEVRSRLAHLSGQLESAVAQRQKLGESEACPLCGSTTEIVSARERIEDAISALNEQRAALTQEEAELSVRVEAAAESERERFAILDHNSSVRRECERLEERARELQSVIAAITDNDWNGMEADNSTLSPEDEQKVKERIAEVEDSIETLRARNDAWVAQQNAITRRDADETRMLEASCRASVLSESSKAVLEHVASAGEKAFGKVLAVAARVTDGVLRSPLQWMDGGLGRFVSVNDEFERGCKARVGSWIPWESFSGTERAVALCAFSVALAMSSPFRLAIIDELGRLTAQMRVRLLENLGRMVADGTLHQAVVIAATTDKADVAAMTGFAIEGNGIDGAACFVSNGLVECCQMRSVQTADPEKPKRSRKVKA